MAETDIIDQPKRKPGRPRKVPAAAAKAVIPTIVKSAPVEPAKPAPVTAAAKAPEPVVKVEAAAKAPKPVAKAPASALKPKAPEPVAKAEKTPAPVIEPVKVPEPVAKVVEAVEAAIPAPAQVAKVIEAVSSPAVSSDVIEAPAVAAAAPKEEVKTMATIEIPTVEKAQAIFGDVSARIKTAFEKSTKVGEELVDLAKGNAEAVVASAKIAAKGGETLGQEAAEYGKKSFESAMALFKSFTSVRTPSEFFQLQSDYAKASIESLVAETSKTSESLLKLAGEVVQPLSNRYAVATEKLKAATTL